MCTSTNNNYTCDQQKGDALNIIDHKISVYIDKPPVHSRPLVLTSPSSLVGTCPLSVSRFDCLGAHGLGFPCNRSIVLIVLGHFATYIYIHYFQHSIAITLGQ